MNFNNSYLWLNSGKCVGVGVSNYTLEGNYTVTENHLVVLSCSMVWKHHLDLVLTQRICFFLPILAHQESQFANNRELSRRFPCAKMVLVIINVHTFCAPVSTSPRALMCPHSGAAVQVSTVLCRNYRKAFQNFHEVFLHQNILKSHYFCSSFFIM